MSINELLRQNLAKRKCPLANRAFEERLMPITAQVAIPEDIEPLSQIIHELNERFGTDFTEENKVFIRQLEQRIANDPALEASILVNPPEDARLTFNQVVNDKLQDMVDSNFKFYKQITDNADFAEDFLSWMFERYYRAKKGGEKSGK